MQLSEERREWGLWPNRIWACSAIALALVLACTVSAQEPKAPQNTGAQPAATTKPAQAPAEDAAAQGVEGLKRLIEEKMKEQGVDPAAQPAQPSANTPPARRAKPAAGQTPQRVFLSKEAIPTSAPSQNSPAGSQPAKGCSAGGKGAQVDLTPPAPDQPQPRWSLEQDTVEAPPVWRGKDAKFVFRATNAGEGVLNIQMKGG